MIYKKPKCSSRGKPANWLRSNLRNAIKSRLFLLSVAAVTAIAPTVGAVEVPTTEMGRLLFESSQLGNMNRSCSTCHPGGKGLENNGDFTDNELKDLINACIRDALHGKPLAADSQELESLLRQVRTFGK